MTKYASCKYFTNESIPYIIITKIEMSVNAAD
jgi:hypothetical protein